VLDENEESMARLKMVVDEWKRDQIEEAALDLIESATQGSTAHWKVGSPEPCVSPHGPETSNPTFRNFNMWLREYLAHHHPSYTVRFEDEIKVDSNVSGSFAD
jgi:hypothetical protein